MQLLVKESSEIINKSTITFVWIKEFEDNSIKFPIIISGLFVFEEI